MNECKIFLESSLSDYLVGFKCKLAKKIKQLSLLEVKSEELVLDLLVNIQLPVLNSEQISLREHEGGVDFVVPFKGNGYFFRLQPSHYSSLIGFEVFLFSNYFIIRFAKRSLIDGLLRHNTINLIGEEFKDRLSIINRHLEYMKTDVQQEELATFIEKQRATRLAELQELNDLGYPLINKLKK